MRFLLADSDTAYTAQLKAMIQSCCPDDVEIDHITSAQSALAKLQANTYDLCFLDYQLETSATGLDVLKALHAGHTLTAFIILTDVASKDAAFAALTLGASDYLIKKRFTDFELAKCIAYTLYLKSREAGLQKEALNDSLTGLGNKGLFDAQLKQAALRAQRDKEKLGLLVIDIDSFKAINDKHGHKVGDQLLQQVAERIVNETRASDVVARIGGDEFAAILIKPKSPELIYSIGKKLEKALSEMPYNVSGTILKVGASVGTAVLPDDTTNLDQLFTLADKGMYRNKNAKKAALGASRDYLDQVLR